MNTVLNSEQMRCCDLYTSEHFGVPSIVLMERAALAVAEVVAKRAPRKVFVVCGCGNNGADGLAVARILYEKGIEADYTIPFDPGKHSELFDRQLSVLRKYGKNPIENTKEIIEEILAEYDLIVDALFGIGLSRPLSDEISKYIGSLNNAKAYRVAVDIPSGLNADNGFSMGTVFKADVTVTFGFRKSGQVLAAGRNFVGELICEGIGITDNSLESISGSKIYEMTLGDVVLTLPERPANGNKGTFGKVLIYAGSEGMSGACILAAKAAFRVGAGMVRVISCSSNINLLSQVLPEAMTMDAEEDREQILNAVNWCDCMLIGPGIGKSVKASDMMKTLIESGRDKLLVVDADGLNILADNNSLQQLIADRKPGSTIFTPHMGELSRLTGMPVKEIQERLPEVCNEYAANNNVILIAKDAVTFVSDGKTGTIVAAGNSGMATAGSGDVLAGTAAALSAFKADGDNIMYTAACNAVYIHGYAGGICADRLSEDSVMAGDIANALPEAVGKIRDMQKQGK